jgi:Flp pilus assembly protein CpaB
MTVVVFAILVGLAGAFVVRQEMAKSKRSDIGPPAVKPQPILVPVAAMQLEPGQTLALNDIALIPLTPEAFAKSKFAKMTFMSNTTQILGRTLKMGLQKDEVFLPEFLYPEGLGPGISDKIQAGYRAVTVPIQNAGAVQGFARPGTWVDVIFRADSRGPRRPEMTMTLLERVEVLAINESLMANRQVNVKDEGTVTLAVTPTQAKALKVVEGRGELSLALRHADDTLDMAPFDIGQFDPAPGTMSLAAGVIPVSHANDATANRSDRIGAKDRASLDGVMGDSSESVTLDDLLGFGRGLEKRQVEIYMGATKTVVEFDEPEDYVPTFVPAGRIRTPIAHGPTPATTQPAGQVRRTTTTQQPAFLTRDRS